MKIFNIKGKSFTGLFIKTFFISIIAVVLAIVVFVGTTFIQLKNNIVDKFYTDINVALHGTKVLPNDFKDLDNDYVLKNNGWIEILENQEVKEVIGNKKDSTILYNENLITYMDENGDAFVGETIEPLDNDYSVKVYTADEKTYLVKIPRLSTTLNEYIDSMMDIDEKSKAFDEFKKVTIKVTIMPVILGIMTFIIIVGLHIFLSIKSIKKPLNKIQNGINEMASGNMNARIDFYSYSELNEIKDNFNYMIEKIDKAEKEKTKSEESKKNMIRDISHDIKTPMTSVLGYSKAIMEKEYMSDEERDTYLGYIYHKTQRMDYLINELFKFVELDTYNYKLNKNKKDYIEFIREVVLLHYKDIEEKKFDLELYLCEDEVIIEFDDKNMERAISNLIMNAIKYNNEGTRIKISVKSVKNEIITIIEDDGVGIEEAVCENVFDEFVRGDKSRNSQGGSGLGLAITKKIVELHGGSISVESKLDEGSRFIIKLSI